MKLTSVSWAGKGSRTEGSRASRSKRERGRKIHSMSSPGSVGVEGKKREIRASREIGPQASEGQDEGVGQQGGGSEREKGCGAAGRVVAAGRGRRKSPGGVTGGAGP